ncbi:hypothetical protein D3C75_1119150 [compost metagenome]
MPLNGDDYTGTWPGKNTSVNISILHDRLQDHFDRIKLHNGLIQLPFHPDTTRITKLLNVKIGPNMLKFIPD